MYSNFILYNYWTIYEHWELSGLLHHLAHPHFQMFILVFHHLMRSSLPVLLLHMRNLVMLLLPKMCIFEMKHVMWMHNCLMTMMMMMVLLLHCFHLCLSGLLPLLSTTNFLASPLARRSKLTPTQGLFQRALLIFTNIIFLHLRLFWAWSILTKIMKVFSENDMVFYDPHMY